MAIYSNLCYLESGVTYSEIPSSDNQTTEKTTPLVESLPSELSLGDNLVTGDAPSVDILVSVEAPSPNNPPAEDVVTLDIHASGEHADECITNGEAEPVNSDAAIEKHPSLDNVFSEQNGVADEVNY